MNISAELIKTLRERTGAGFLDCKNALIETGGDLEKAVEKLRVQGLAKALKKEGREAKAGLVHSYIHGEGRIGVLVEVNCETDFVARTEDFRQLVREIALQIAANSPLVVRREELPPELIEKERRIYEEQAKKEGKPAHVIERIVNGKLENFYKEVVLLEQPYFREPKKSVEELIKEAIARLGENIVVRRFARFVLGGG
jgi:elongation factor Ts